MKTLYKLNDNGKIQVWSIKTYIDEDGVAVIENQYGLFNGKITTKKSYVRKGVNIGKKNERSPIQKAVFDAGVKIKKKIEDNMVENINNIYLPPKYLKPMLAYPSKDIKFTEEMFPCFVQPKFDGVRCVVYNHVGDGRALSRENKHLAPLKHIEKAAKEVFGTLSPDGEVYNHELTFQENIRLIKKYREGKTETLKYMVYDLVIPDMPFEERLSLLRKIVPEDHPTIQVAETKLVKSIKDLYDLQGRYLENGYEGAIIRDPKGLYQTNKRPKCLIKFKPDVEEEEFEIVGYEVEEYFDSLNDSNFDMVIWKCKTKDGAEFNVRPKGSFKEREKVLKTAWKQIGKMLTVEYQDLSEDRVPRFPISKAIRDYE